AIAGGAICASVNATANASSADILVGVVMLGLPITRFALGDVAHNRVLELAVLLARAGTAVRNLRELLFRLGEIALLQVALAEILACAQIIRIERQRALVVVETLVDVAELPRRVDDHVQHARLLLLLDARQKIARFLEMAFIGESDGFSVEVLICQRSRMAVDASLLLAAPHIAVPATNLGAALMPSAVFVADGAFALGLLGRFGIAAFSVGQRMAGEDAKAREQDQTAERAAHRDPRPSRLAMFLHCLCLFAA